MTITPANDTHAKPATLVVSLDERRDERSAFAVELRRTADLFRSLAAQLRSPLVPDAAIDEPPTTEEALERETTVARLRDRGASLASLRAAFPPIASSLAKLAALAREVDDALRADGEPSQERLLDAIRIASAIENRQDLDGGGSLGCDATSEVWQYAGLLAGELVVAENGDVVDAEPIAS